MTLIVSLTVSGCTINFNPFESVVTFGCTVETGMECSFNFRAQPGSGTVELFVDAKDSVPLDDADEIGWPEGRGVKIAEIDCLGSRRRCAMARTSSRVTF